MNKHDMKFNGSTPVMKVDPETFVSAELIARHLEKCMLILWRRSWLMVFRALPNHLLGLRWASSISSSRRLSRMVGWQVIGGV